MECGPQVWSYDTSYGGHSSLLFITLSGITNADSVALELYQNWVLTPKRLPLDGNHHFQASEAVAQFPFSGVWIGYDVTLLAYKGDVAARLVLPNPYRDAEMR